MPSGLRFFLEYNASTPFIATNFLVQQTCQIHCSAFPLSVTHLQYTHTLSGVFAFEKETPLEKLKRVIPWAHLPENSSRKRGSMSSACSCCGFGQMFVDCIEYATRVSTCKPRRWMQLKMICWYRDWKRRLVFNSIAVYKQPRTFLLFQAKIKTKNNASPRDMV